MLNFFYGLSFSSRGQALSIRIRMPILSLVIYIIYCPVPYAPVTALSSIAPSPPRPPHSHESSPSLHAVAVLGVGDLRINDRPHTPVDAFAILLTDDNIRNLPSAKTHTIDTVNCIHAAYVDIERQLHRRCRATTTTTNKNNDKNNRPFFYYCEKVSELPSAEQYHVCDLGCVDNELAYGAYAAIMSSTSFSDSSTTSASLCLHTITHHHPKDKLSLWTDVLRLEPWQNVDRFQGGNYPDYERTFVHAKPFLPPMARTEGILRRDSGSSRQLEADSSHPFNYTTIIPSVEDLLDRFLQVLQITRETAEVEANTGLYATHWGGLEPSTAAETAVLQILPQTLRLDTLSLPVHSANARSLDHQSSLWQMKTAWMIPGEATVRFLAAPLLMGTVSQRRLRHLAQQPTYNEPLRNLLEGREWHKLLAAATLRQNLSIHAPSPVVRYWRWQGFLCRYLKSPSSPSTPSASLSSLSLNDKATACIDPSLVLLHGFGASAIQWIDVIQAFSSSSSSTSSTTETFAPDQLGFGHAEKPGLSYTAYLWDSMLTDFCKEIVLKKYIVAGNSIGGFTSLSLAASDAATAHHLWTSNGAPGAGQCVGLVLCNSAGIIISRDEANALPGARTRQPQPSIAKQTVLGGLPPCKPPPRFIARAFANFLLSQLRPRIQSICKNLYPVNTSAVDEALCAEIARDSLDPGAIYVMMSGSKLPPPRTANELLQADFASGNSEEESTFAGPVLIAQGILDPLNDAEDRMKRYAALRSGITMHPIQAGHCPHDEVPEQVADAISKWMQSTGIANKNAQ